MLTLQREVVDIASKTERFNNADEKMRDFLSVCRSSTDKTMRKNLTDRYGSITEALTGIFPQIDDPKAEKERTLIEKYENIY